MADEDTALTVPLPRLPGYEVLGRLGDGGFGDVYRVRPEQGGAPLAAKVPRLDAAPGLEGRFRDEVRVLRALSVSTVPRFVEAGDTPQPYVVMELVEGETLFDLLAQPASSRGRWEVLRGVLPGILEALEALHGKGVVHRDLKPQNMMERRDGGVGVLLDMGLVKAAVLETRTRTGTLMGTPAYMAPEQLSGTTKAYGPETDAYQMARVLCLALDGSLFDPEAHTPARAFARSRSPPTVPEEVLADLPVASPLGEWLLAALRLDPGDRPEGRGHLRRLRHLFASPPPPEVAGIAPPTRRRAAPRRAARSTPASETLPGAQATAPAALPSAVPGGPAPAPRRPFFRLWVAAGAFGLLALGVALSVEWGEELGAPRSDPPPTDGSAIPAPEARARRLLEAFDTALGAAGGYWIDDAIEEVALAPDTAPRSAAAPYRDGAGPRSGDHGPLLSSDPERWSLLLETVPDLRILLDPRSPAFRELQEHGTDAQLLARHRRLERLDLPSPWLPFLAARGSSPEDLARLARERLRRGREELEELGDWKARHGITFPGGAGDEGPLRLRSDTDWLRAWWPTAHFRRRLQGTLRPASEELVAGIALALRSLTSREDPELLGEVDALFAEPGVREVLGVAVETDAFLARVPREDLRTPLVGGLYARLLEGVWFYRRRASPAGARSLLVAYADAATSLAELSSATGARSFYLDALERLAVAHLYLDEPVRVAELFSTFRERTVDEPEERHAERRTRALLAFRVIAAAAEVADPAGLPVREARELLRDPRYRGLLVPEQQEVLDRLRQALDP